MLSGTGSGSQGLGAHASRTTAHHPHGPPLQALTGDWRSVLTDLQRIEGLAPGEVREACQRWLRPDNCFKGFVLPG